MTQLLSFSFPQLKEASFNAPPETESIIGVCSRWFGLSFTVAVYYFTLKRLTDLTNEIQTRLSAVTELSGFGFPKFKSTTLIFLNYQIKNFWGVHDLFWRVFFICQQSIFNLDSLFNTYQKTMFFVINRGISNRKKIIRILSVMKIHGVPVNEVKIWPEIQTSLLY